MAEEKVCEWAVEYINDNLNETAILDYVEESCKADSFPDFVCTFIYDHLQEIYEFIFDGEACKYLLAKC